jgi:uncharacterized protein
MRYLIDIGHPAHINFLKQSISILNSSDDVFVTYLDRGVLPKIVSREILEARTYKIGKHRGTKWSIIVEANIFRFFKMLLFILKHRIDVGVNGGFPVGLALRLLGRKYIQFDDDIERKLTVFLEKSLANKLFFPAFIPNSSKFLKFNALKEWAYLSPKYFVPDHSVLKEYSVIPDNYIFIREVSNKSFNYMGQHAALILGIAQELSEIGLPVILSLEDKSLKNQYPEDWIILKEPVNCIHSLMYFSTVIISSGDSMAREGAMLGKPSIYCGSRFMMANEMMISKGMLLHKKIDDVPLTVKHIIANELPFPAQAEFRARLLHEWVDVTEFIVDQIRNIKK